MFRVDNTPCDHPGGGEQMTKQSFKDQCDINNILSQYQRTGVISHRNDAPPLFLDLPSAMDLQDAMLAVELAANSFAALPAAVREEFGNDPLRLVAATHDPAMKPRLIELGLIDKPKQEEGPPPQSAPSVSPPPE